MSQGATETGADAMSDPFRIEWPAVISFSGGRTSAYMLRRILDAYDDQLPDDVRVVFANTGKEREETLVFVERCATEWGLDVVWVERQPGGDPLRVDFTTAARNGEPFDAIIHERTYCPGPMARFCSTELKIRTIDRWVRRICGFPRDWNNVVGIRGDEPKRAAKMLGGSHHMPWVVVLPLYRALVTEADVLSYWAQSQFDLGLRSDQGNCDMCFLKSANKVKNLIREEPERAVWWMAHEQAMNSTFRMDRPSYAAMLAQGDLFVASGDDLIECYCTD
jgi:3'-phosphoadenosine 5'-phosphosulfate sulfotransferase (PAPS reductase)/FAD synthetase